MTVCMNRRLVLRWPSGRAIRSTCVVHEQECTPEMVIFGRCAMVASRHSTAHSILLHSNQHVAGQREQVGREL